MVVVDTSIFGGTLNSQTRGPELEDCFDSFSLPDFVFFPPHVNDESSGTLLTGKQLATTLIFHYFNDFD